MKNNRKEIVTVLHIFQVIKQITRRLCDLMVPPLDPCVTESTVCQPGKIITIFN